MKATKIQEIGSNRGMVIRELPGFNEEENAARKNL
jgi:hypothetical protein